MGKASFPLSEELEHLADDIEAQWYANPRPSGLYTGVCGEIRIVLEAPRELLTLNIARGRIGWHQWAELTKAWRCAMRDRALLLGIPPQKTRVAIEAHPQQKGGVLADPGAHMPTVKACIDGLRDAGVLVDDSPAHVAWVRCWAPIKAKPAGLVLELLPAP